MAEFTFADKVSWQVLVGVNVPIWRSIQRAVVSSNVGWGCHWHNEEGRFRLGSASGWLEMDLRSGLLDPDSPNPLLARQDYALPIPCRLLIGQTLIWEGMLEPDEPELIVTDKDTSRWPLRGKYFDDLEAPFTNWYSPYVQSDKADADRELGGATFEDAWERACNDPTSDTSPTRNVDPPGGSDAALSDKIVGFYGVGTRGNTLAAIAHAGGGVPIEDNEGRWMLVDIGWLYKNTSGQPVIGPDIPAGAVNGDEAPYNKGSSIRIKAPATCWGVNAKGFVNLPETFEIADYDEEDFATLANVQSRSQPAADGLYETTPGGVSFIVPGNERVFWVGTLVTGYEVDGVTVGIKIENDEGFHLPGDKVRREGTFQAFGESPFGPGTLTIKGKVLRDSSTEVDIWPDGPTAFHRPLPWKGDLSELGHRWAIHNANLPHYLFDVEWPVWDTEPAVLNGTAFPPPGTLGYLPVKVGQYVPVLVTRVQHIWSREQDPAFRCEAIGLSGYNEVDGGASPQTPSPSQANASQPLAPARCGGQAPRESFIVFPRFQGVDNIDVATLVYNDASKMYAGTTRRLGVPAGLPAGVYRPGAGYGNHFIFGNFQTGQLWKVAYPDLPIQTGQSSPRAQQIGSRMPSGALSGSKGLYLVMVIGNVILGLVSTSSASSAVEVWWMNAGAINSGVGTWTKDTSASLPAGQPEAVAGNLYTSLGSGGRIIRVSAARAHASPTPLITHEVVRGYPSGYGNIASWKGDKVLAWDGSKLAELDLGSTVKTEKTDIGTLSPFAGSARQQLIPFFG